MTGLSKILEQIKEESDSNVRDIIDRAKAEADEIIQKAELDANVKAGEISEKYKAKAADIIERAKSAGELRSRKEILFKKQEIIGDIIEKAKNTLCNLPDNEYFEILIKTIMKFANGIEGEIVFSEKDKGRMPSSFIDKLKSDAPYLKISEKTINSDGGFVLIYGDIEENSTFSALFESEREELLGKVNSLLFD